MLVNAVSFPISQSSRPNTHTDEVCGNVPANGGSKAPLADCNMPCVGNLSEWCGGSNRLNLYQLDGAYDKLQPTSIGLPAPTPTAPSNKPVVGNYAYYSCQTEGNNTRALTPAASTS